MKYLSLIFGVAAIWLMAAPFVLGYAETTAAMRNDVVVGAVMLVLSLWEGYWELKDHGWGIGVQTKHS